MVKVTSVEPQKKNPKRFNVFLDGQFAFGADEDLVVDYRLVPGKAIDPADLDKILFDGEVGKLMERVYGLFNIRMRSEKELRDYLKNLSFKRKIKGKDEISPIVIESTIDRAMQKGLVNDLEFAKSWIEGRSKKYGINRIKQELAQKGIDRQIIEEVAISSQPSGASIEETAINLLERKLRSWRALQPQEFKKKASDFLLRRGFEYSVVRKVVDNIIEKGYN
jgi:regulatory protein